MTPPPLFNPPSAIQVNRPESRQSSRSLGTHSRVILAFDFGTGYSSASYVLIDPGPTSVSSILEKVQAIYDYPECNRNRDDVSSHQVPTELIYSLGGPPARTTRQTRARVDEEDDPFPDWDRDNQSVSSFDSLNLRHDRNECYRWGYSVHQAWLEVSTVQFKKFKLLLQDDVETAGVRERLHRDLETLASRGRRKKPIDLIVDFLTPFVAHVRNSLEEKGHYAGTDKEIVMCIPTIWSQKACRKMHLALAKAFESAKFEGVEVEHNSIKNLFIVSEPEAAAEIVLREHVEIRVSRSAGTVDLITYLVSYEEPLRLKEEGAPPSGGMCGSGFLNESFQAYILGLLKKHREMSKKDDEFLQRKAEEITWTHFEFELKRSFDIYEGPSPRYRHIRTNGVIDDRANGFANDYVIVPLKVVLIGGFSASRSLRAYLKRSLANYDGGRTQLITPKMNHGTTVSSGAVIRAFDKTHGPQRFARSSYGLLRHLPKDVYDSKHQKRNHHDANERTTPAPCTKEPYVRNTIEWFIKKVFFLSISFGSILAPASLLIGVIAAQNDMIPEDWTRKPIRCQHFVTHCADPNLVVWERLYVSDHATESFYKKSHPRNKGCEHIGWIEVDMTFLKHEGLLELKPAPGGCDGDYYYEVEFDLVMKVKDRDLQCFAKYGDRTLRECQINIASAFAAGVQ
ncbi:hypothetical protein PG985_010999 [Apiospora marii]|uniref:uncharacterized protein n=1 Tax=Apiospora marii TaxID=335849 RepID=UPI00313171E9